VTPRVLHEAEIEVVEAALRCDREQSGLGAVFLTAVGEAIDLIAAHGGISWLPSRHRH
jgi:hypothetical protein